MNNQQNKGFIHIIIIVVLLLIIISLLGVSLQSVFSNTLLQQNFGFVGNWLSTLWHSVIFAPIRGIIDLFIIPAWDRFLNILRGGINFNTPSNTSF